ncbi:BAB2_0123 family type IV secretion system effector [Bartonella ancashensis]|uniref:Uncharacterized protein n=1 Tax=Bartonella ancashensis TaxID=1318743 RepID=A0A0M4L774_9HYPH|nr:hypothetical protein [Bartonella ancashensis]ALE02976.1 hypothetical protein PU02_0162 [Bartonella ancashensis]
MSWFMVNIISTLLALISLGVFIRVARKLKETMHTGRELAEQIQVSTSHLDHIISVLREEYQEIHDENRKMDARIIESTRIRREIDRSLAHMEEVRHQLQNDFNLLRSVPTPPPAPQTHEPTPQTHEHVTKPTIINTNQQKAVIPKRFPTFMQQRQMHKMSAYNKQQPTISKKLPVFVQHKTYQTPLKNAAYPQNNPSSHSNP